MPQLVRSLEREVGSVSSVSASGNPFQPTLFYRGFAASPLQGTPQGLAVYVNGMRFNQPFGDTVDWDLIPDVAIDRINLEGSNPVFGLNALGGSVNVRLKNGFTFQGFEAAVAGGSFGHVQGEFQFGTAAAKTLRRMSRAAPCTRTAGATCSRPTSRTSSPTSAGAASGRAALQRHRARNSVLNGPGTAPVELLAVAPSAQFTAPNSDRQHLCGGQPVGQRRRGRHAFAAGAGLLPLLPAKGDQRQCAERHALPGRRQCRPAVLLGRAQHDAGRRLHHRLPERRANTAARQPDHQHAMPTAAACSSPTRASCSAATTTLSSGRASTAAQTQFSATSFIGGLTSGDRCFIGPGVVIDEPGTNSPVSVAIANAT